MPVDCQLLGGSISPQLIGKNCRPSACSLEVGSSRASGLLSVLIGTYVAPTSAQNAASYEPMANPVSYLGKGRDKVGGWNNQLRWDFVVNLIFVVFDKELGLGYRLTSEPLHQVAKFTNIYTNKIDTSNYWLSTY
eukprot:2556888-Ditylum_brightwellii.AAC.1